MTAASYLVLEALVAFAVVMGVHALRRRTSLVYSYAVLAFMRLGSWAAGPAAPVTIGPVELSVGSNVFLLIVTVGAVVSGVTPVVKLHTKSLANALPARSLAPVVIVAVYVVLSTRLLAGVKVATLVRGA